MRRRGQHSGNRRNLFRCIQRVDRYIRNWRGIQLNRFQNPSKLIGTKDEIDFRNFFLDFVAIALGEATGDDEFLAVAGRLQPGHFQNRIDGFLFCAIDETARIDDDDIGIFFVGSDGVALPARVPSMTSLSTRFFGQPRLTNPTLGVVLSDIL